MWLPTPLNFTGVLIMSGTPVINSSATLALCKLPRLSESTLEALPPIVVDDSEDDDHSDDSEDMISCGTPTVSIPAYLDGALRDDIVEIFSPPRCIVEAARRGFRATLAMDLTTGFNFSTTVDRFRCLRELECRRPRAVATGAPCTMFSALQECFKNFEKIEVSQLSDKFHEGEILLDFSMYVCAQQMRLGAKFVHEHPARATSWTRSSVTSLVNQPPCTVTLFDQCSVGLVSPKGTPVKKKTKLLSNAPRIADLFAVARCKCSVKHREIQGSENGHKMSTWCQC